MGLDRRLRLASVSGRAGRGVGRRAREPSRGSGAMGGCAATGDNGRFLALVEEARERSRLPAEFELLAPQIIRGTPPSFGASPSPPEIEWFANISDPRTRRIYKIAVRDCMESPALFVIGRNSAPSSSPPWPAASRVVVDKRVRAGGSGRNRVFSPLSSTLRIRHAAARMLKVRHLELARLFALKRMVEQRREDRPRCTNQRVSSWHRLLRGHVRHRRPLSS